MYCIDVLTDKAQSGREYTEYILNCCAERNIFPLVQVYYDQEKFFAQIQKTGHCTSDTAGSERTQCSRASSVSVSEMQDHLEQ